MGQKNGEGCELGGEIQNAMKSVGECTHTHIHAYTSARVFLWKKSYRYEECWLR